MKDKIRVSNWVVSKKKRVAEKENVGKKTKTERKQKNKLSKKIQHVFEEVKQKAIATGEGKVFFPPLWAKPKSWKQQKNKQKKKGFAAFLLFQVSKQR